jgi:hypothetical protein
MSPILGIWASGASAAASVGDYESIATVTVGAGGSSTVTFSSIPSAYQHLQIRGIMLSTTANHADVTLNSDTGNNYAAHQLEGNGAGVNADAGASRSNMFSLFWTPGTTNGIGGGVIDILDYANTNKNKTLRSLRGADNNGSGTIALMSGLWMNTTAVTSITLTARGGTFTQYSSFALYGIKG